MKKISKRAVALAITTGFLYLIYSRIDLRVFYNNIVNLNKTYLLWALSLFLVIPLVKAYRWKIILGKELNSTYFMILKILMAGSVFNLFTPSKLGDFSRMYFCRKELTSETERIFNSVIAEKICDVFALCFICLINLIFVDVKYNIKISIVIFSFILLMAFFVIINLDFHKIKLLNHLFQKVNLMELFDDARRLKSEIKHNKIFFIKIFCVSIFYWHIVLFQIYLFFLIFNLKVSFLLVIGLVPVALFIGMIPITVSGIGTRDVALIFLFSDYFSSEIMAGIGILCSSRYLISCLLGLPFFLMHYFSENKIQELRVEN